MNREEEIKVIINELVKLKSIIETENKLNLTDKNIFLEDIVSQVINIMYEYYLKNTNFNICNYPCIDLIDENNDNLLNQEEIVYWTPNGKTYHSKSTCRTLARSKIINSGTVNESGKDFKCENCK